MLKNAEQCRYYYSLQVSALDHAGAFINYSKSTIVIILIIKLVCQLHVLAQLNSVTSSQEHDVLIK